MLKAFFYLKASKLYIDEIPIFIKLSHNRKSITLCTGKSISKDRWIFTNKLRNLLKIEKEKVIKWHLDTLLLKADKKYLEMELLGLEISLSDLKAYLKGKSIDPNAKPFTIIEAFQKHNTNFKRKVDFGERTKASMQKYKRSQDLILKYIQKYYLINDYPVNDINSSFIYQLESFLKYESVYRGKIAIKNNSVVKYFHNFKTIFAYAIKMNLIKKNPFDIYDGKISVKEAQFLTQQELNSIEQIPLSNRRLEKVKDIFLFNCYTGYAPIDVFQFDKQSCI